MHKGPKLATPWGHLLLYAHFVLIFSKTIRPTTHVSGIGSLSVFFQLVKLFHFLASQFPIYTETIKLCPLDVYVCQFLMYERISFNFLHYKLLSLRNVMHLNEIHLITSRAADNSENTSTLKIKSHNINSLCVHNNSEQFKHIKTSLSKLSSKMLCMLAVCIAFTTTTINL